MPFLIKRERRVCGPQSKREEKPGHVRRRHIEHAGVPLRNLVEIAILTVGVNGAVLINGWRVDTPLEAVGMVRRASEGPTCTAHAALRLDAVELPFGHEVRVELCDVERPCWNACMGANDIAHAPCWVAVKARFLVVVVVLDDNRVCAAVLPDSRRGIPTEVKVGHDCTGLSVEFDEVAARNVVPGIRAVGHVAVWCHRWRAGARRVASISCRAGRRTSAAPMEHSRGCPTARLSRTQRSPRRTVKIACNSEQTDGEYACNSEQICLSCLSRFVEFPIEERAAPAIDTQVHAEYLAIARSFWSHPA